MKVLFVTSEAYPLVKTGGLADVCGSLPPALMTLGADLRLLLPAYREARAAAGRLSTRISFMPAGANEPVTLLEGTLPGTRVPLWLVDCPNAFDRPGNPYLDTHGMPWADNASRFALLARTAVAIACGDAGLRWRPDIVHGHDWQAGLVPALLANQPKRAASVFTVHNLSYQGLFPYETFRALGLPESLWTFDGVEFHGQLSFIKGGLAFADGITTVSPTYAREIQTPAFGCGLEGLLHHRRAQLHGILNGIDTKEWNPLHDPRLAAPYSATRMGGKAENKRALQAAFGLPEARDLPLIGMVGRLVEQKGFDLVLDALPELACLPLQVVVLGTGAVELEQRMQAATAQQGAWFAARIGYDEALAHRIQAGADMLLMPSRYEPCGLSQMHALRYGTLPIVRRTGGLADSVVDAGAAGQATGIVFDGATPAALVAAIERALALYRDAKKWKQLVRTGMAQDFSWRASAQEYLALYESLRAPHA